MVEDVVVVERGRTTDMPLPQTLKRRLAWLRRHPTSAINYGTDNQLARLGIVHVDHCAGLTQLLDPHGKEVPAEHAPTLPTSVIVA